MNRDCGTAFALAERLIICEAVSGLGYMHFENLIVASYFYNVDLCHLLLNWPILLIILQFFLAVPSLS